MFEETAFSCCQHDSCVSCTGDYVCHCLKITEQAVLLAINSGARSLCDLRCITGAGDGCTACHRRLVTILERETKADVRELQPLVMA